MQDADWQSIWDAAGKIVAIVWTGATALFVWLLSKYRFHVSMLLRHDKQLEANDIELGKLRQMRIATDDGKKALRMIATVKRSVRMLDEEFTERKAKDEKRDGKIEEILSKLATLIEKTSNLERRLNER